MIENILTHFEIQDSFKAFCILFARMIVKNPSLLLITEKIHPKTATDGYWKTLYNNLQQENNRFNFLNNLEKTAASYDWSHINEVFIGWGKYGWITDIELDSFGFWDILPPTQEEADNKVLPKITTTYLSTLRNELNKKNSCHNMFDEACFCFDNSLYYACASLLSSLIDGTLISSSANFNSTNRKTGKGACKKVINELCKDNLWGLPGYYNLELINYTSFINLLFARTNSFENEPLNLNRNFLHHGMSNRIVTRTDCFKLFIAYKKTIEISRFQRDLENQSN